MATRPAAATAPTVVTAAVEARRCAAPPLRSEPSPPREARVSSRACWLAALAFTIVHPSRRTPLTQCASGTPMVVVPLLKSQQESAGLDQEYWPHCSLAERHASAHVRSERASTMERKVGVSRRVPGERKKHAVGSLTRGAWPRAAWRRARCICCSHSRLAAARCCASWSSGPCEVHPVAAPGEAMRMTPHPAASPSSPTSMTSVRPSTACKPSPVASAMCRLIVPAPLASARNSEPAHASRAAPTARASTHE
mmetsp:Transcript_24097/g.75110  ORF Transcript_24097/g.75110 Transcript_24097/m.75110 type:complete len:253 (+) Transcript_24097:274-1032(+)